MRLVIRRPRVWGAPGIHSSGCCSLSLGCRPQTWSGTSIYLNNTSPSGQTVNLGTAATGSDPSKAQLSGGPGMRIQDIAPSDVTRNDAGLGTVTVTRSGDAPLVCHEISCLSISAWCACHLTCRLS